MCCAVAPRSLHHHRNVDRSRDVLCSNSLPLVRGVRQSSYAPRDLKALNENMEFPGVDSKMLTTLEQRMAEALRKKVFAAGGIHQYYKDTFAENPADRKNLVLTEDVALTKPLDTSIRPISAVYSELAAEKGLEVSYVRLPIVDER